MKKTYWKGIEQLKNDPSFIKNADKEFPEHLTIKDAYGDNSDAVSGNRRDFLKLMGFSLAAVSMAACETPVKKAIPLLNKPENLDPGIPNYYASTYSEGGEWCPVVVKTRDGRPIFLEGNTFCSFTNGGTNGRVNAAVMSLYDIEKAKHPTKSGEKINWADLDKEITSKLAEIGLQNAPIYVVANTIISPSTKAVLAKFMEKYPSAKLVTYDAESSNAIVEAHKRDFGVAALPTYQFDKAETIVSFGADFLESWVSGIEHSYAYSKNRKVGKKKKTMSAHFQFESAFSLTGANADYRTPIRPSQQGLAVAKLYNAVAKATGGETLAGLADVEVAHLDKAAQHLLKSKGKSLVVAGSNDLFVQLLVNQINKLLGNYEQTIRLDIPSYTKQGKDAEMNKFVADLEGGKVGAVLFYNCNPVYDHPAGQKIAAAISKTRLSIASADRLDETASLCTFNCPDSHFLESWNDAEPKRGYFSIGQPAINNIFDTRQFQDSLLTWASAGTDYYSMMRKRWQETIFPLQSKESSFEKFWQRVVHDGVYDLREESPESFNTYVSIHHQAADPAEGAMVSLTEVASKIKSAYKAVSDEIELVVYSSPLMGSGRMANNPLLQETPDPMSRVCWGNFVAVSPALAAELKLDYKFETKVPVAKVSVNGVEASLPVVVQPGQDKKTIAIAMGYGRDGAKAGKVAAEAGGTNAFPFVASTSGFLTYDITSGVTLTPTTDLQDIAQTQTHHTIMGRETIIQEATLAEYKENDKAGRFEPMIYTSSGFERPGDISIWDINKDGFGKRDPRLPEEEKEENPVIWGDKDRKKIDTHRYVNHHWALNIDLNSCTGCGACVVACHVENNVPVVGKQEVIRRREMHWLRIDRYYSSPVNASTNSELEKAAENPEVVFQPMMCQHCNNAPCETVCPVAATTHSSEGLNQMTYNRCVGTKYCANNCPYKVRRFNWFKYHDNQDFDYHMNNDLGKMVLNPDVTVRSRGVMEKCSMCVQRIQAGKLLAKREGRRMKDGDASVACASACPTQAITFGDLNNQAGKVRQLMDQEVDGRAYHVLEELNVSPNVWYMTKIRNKDRADA
jgi:molybdopterin-containing oxidoreductase family iron-sulfur binding subunit